MFRITVFVLAILLFASGVVLGFCDKAQAAGLTYGAAGICLIFVFLSAFKKFKAFGIEAELLERKIEEADKLLSQLRDISVPIAELLFSSTARMGRLCSLTRVQKYELIQRIEQELKKCGVPDPQIEQAKSDWHYFNIYDMCTPVIKEIIDVLNNHVKEYHRVISEISQPITSDKRNDYEKLITRITIASKEIKILDDLRAQKKQSEISLQIVAIISNSEVLTKEDKEHLLQNFDEQIKDIEYYVKNKDFRRLSVWLSSDDEE
jgi:hypothetical protein